MSGFRIGPIRPPCEANSLLLQVTNGCTWNKCKFCGLYKHTKFKTYSLDSIKEDIDNMKRLSDMVLKYKQGNVWDIDGINRKIRELDSDEVESFYMLANWHVNGTGSVFLQDGNSTALRDGRLVDAIIYLKQAFPDITRITSYGRAQNLAQIPKEEFRELKEAGLDRIHSGFESGSDEVLKLVNKGVTQEEEIRAGLNVKGGGIEFSVYFMPGLGGKYLSEENAKGMTEVLNAINADFLRIRTCAVKPGTELNEDYERGDFVLASEDDKVREIRYIIENTHDIETYAVSDHILNLLQLVEGSLKDDKEKLLGVIDGYLLMPEHDRKMFQAARRTMGLLSPDMMDRIAPDQYLRLRELVESTDDDYEWEEYINSVIAQYI